MDFRSLVQKANVISEDKLEELLVHVHEHEASYEESMLDVGIAPEKIRKILAEFYEIPEFEITEDTEVSADVLDYISQESALHYKMMPLALVDGVLTVGVNDPDNLALRDVLNFVSSKYHISYRLVFVLRADLEKAFALYESLTGEVDQALTTLETELDSEIDGSKEEVEEELRHIKEDAPVTKIVATILRYAVDGLASDIHIEPTENNVQVRFRIDGTLQTSLELPQNVQSAVVARVKILSSMRLDERRRPQDGRFSANIDKHKIDFRVSVLPTNHGEKIVMRILDTEKGVRSLSETGVSEHNLIALRKAIKEPFGIILISGPTGSGKSTTLYSMLKEVDRLGKNVLSLEDPVEYNIDGVSQSQVRPEIGYTFADGLRSALRQDPDIIMVGEIRDKETAQLAIQAALTGHLVFSTIHTNNSVGVIPRLIDMGVDPYLIAPTLKLAAAQRLARRLCPGTGTEQKIEGSIEQMIARETEGLPEQYRGVFPDSGSVMHPESTAGCTSGTKGRVAIMETLEITDEIEKLILNGGSETEIYNSARANGFITMKEDAIIKALNHVIPFEEVNTFGLHTTVTATHDGDAFDLDSDPEDRTVDNSSVETKLPVIMNNDENTTG